MKVALYSSSLDTNAGGGITYLLAIAVALKELNHEPVLFFNTDVSLKELKARYKTGKIPIEARKDESLPFLNQIIFAVKEWLHFDAVFYHKTTPPRITLVKKSVLLVDFPAKRVLNRKERLKIRQWKTILVNSDFTRFWTEKYWKREAFVLYPPVSIPEYFIEKKEKSILSIGRFHRGARSKRQDVIIKAFKDFIDKTGSNEYRLDLVGFVQDKNYLNQLKSLAMGYPVNFHLNISSQEKDELLAKAKIYIHACGFDTDEKLNPEHTEHYGIAVVEAMAHSCLVLVVPKGGPASIIENAKNGLHYASKIELGKLLLEVNHKPEAFKNIPIQAFNDAHRYGFSIMKNKLSEILKIL